MDLVGEITSVQGGLHPSPGFLLVILKNGKPKFVVQTGKKYRGMFRAANMEALPVRTGSVQFADLIVPHVVLDGRHRLPNVAVTATVVLNPAREYQYLLQRVQRDGPFFAQNLDTEVSQAIDQLVRTTLGSNTHAELYGRNLTGMFKAGQELLGGLFLLESISKVDPTWDEASVAVDREVLAAQLHVEEDRNLQARADRYGVRSIDLANPDALVASIQAMSELEVERVRQDGALTQAIVENLRQVGRQPDLVERLTGVREVVDLPQKPAAPASLPGGNTWWSAESPSASGPVTGETSSVDRTAGLRPDAEAPASQRPTGATRPQVGSLACPPAVSTIWSSLGLDEDDLVGAAVHQAGQGLIVLCIVESSPTSHEVARFAERVADGYDVESSPNILIVSFSRYFDRLLAAICAELFGQGHPTTDPAAWRFDSNDGVGSIITLLVSDPAHLRVLRTQILDPKTGLQNLLSGLLNGRLVELVVTAAE